MIDKMSWSIRKLYQSCGLNFIAIDINFLNLMGWNIRSSRLWAERDGEELLNESRVMNSAFESFNSMNTRSERDLVNELFISALGGNESDFPYFLVWYAIMSWLLIDQTLFIIHGYVDLYGCKCKAGTLSERD